MIEKWVRAPSLKSEKVTLKVTARSNHLELLNNIKVLGIKQSIKMSQMWLRKVHMKDHLQCDLCAH